MILIDGFTQIIAQIKAAVPEIIKTVIVAHEGHATKKLKDSAGICMVAVIPSAHREGRPGSGIDRNTTWLFILEKDIVGQTDPQEAEQYQRTQETILKIRDWIETHHDDGDVRFTRFTPDSIVIDPEYCEFGGYNGWCMSVTF